MGQAGEKSSASFALVTKVLLLQLGLSAVISVLFWVLKGHVSAYSAFLGGMTCVIPNAFLGLRLAMPRRDTGAGGLIRAAYLGETGKLALTVIMFTMAFTLVRPIAAGALFTGFVAAQLATFAGFLMRDRDDLQVGTKE
jgi:ATP synthase protein I